MRWLGKSGEPFQLREHSLEPLCQVCVGVLWRFGRDSEWRRFRRAGQFWKAGWFASGREGQRGAGTRAGLMAGCPPENARIDGERDLKESRGRESGPFDYAQGRLRGARRVRTR
jgi:hypothetical protein